ncbi:MAG: hypothetical protein RLZZ303_2123 [Candidatus Hydrogenedentota bacterium]|jgi:tetratricopeptide (TPR) repeat protein
MVILLLASLVPYFCWGVYAMHARFLRHHDWPIHIEAATLAAIAAFYAFAFPLLRQYLADTPAAMLFAMLGLFASGAALYGHMAISLTAKLVVDAVTHGGGPAEGPRLGPAEALERVHDYEGAIAEYLILARMYPNDVPVKMRMAECMLKLKRAEDAGYWLDRALEKSDTQAIRSTVVTRLADVAVRELQDVDRARRALAAYLGVYPDAPDRDAILMRLSSLDRQPEEPAKSSLSRLDEAPMIDRDALGTAKTSKKKRAIQLGEALERVETQQGEAGGGAGAAPESAPAALGITPLDRLDDEAAPAHDDPPHEERAHALPGLEALEQVAPQEESEAAPEKEEARENGSRASELERLDG